MKNNLGNKETMSKNIQFYMDKNNISRNDLCSALNVPYTTLRDWLKAITYPRIDKIEMMANYFGISKADLVEERKPVAIPNNELSPLDKELMSFLDKITIEQKKLLLAQLKIMNEQNK